MLISMRAGITMIALGPLVVASVMTARDDLLEQVRFWADRDAMTNLRNRRAFFKEAAELLASGAQASRQFAVMMLDLDHFKSINDRFGHDVGDRVLLEFARILESAIRQQDVVARLGGEEFAAILPNCDRDEALAIAGRINEAIRSKPLLANDEHAFTVTVSIGVHVTRDETNMDRLLAYADRALYDAKNGGRDRCQMAAAC